MQVKRLEGENQRLRDELEAAASEQSRASDSLQEAQRRADTLESKVRHQSVLYVLPRMLNAVIASV